MAEFGDFLIANFSTVFVFFAKGFFRNIPLAICFFVFYSKNPVLGCVVHSMKKKSKDKLKNNQTSAYIFFKANFPLPYLPTAIFSLPLAIFSRHVPYFPAASHIFLPISLDTFHISMIRLLFCYSSYFSCHLPHFPVTSHIT